MEKKEYTIEELLRLFKMGKKRNFEMQESFRHFLFENGFEKTKFGFQVLVRMKASSKNSDSERLFYFIVPYRQDENNKFGLCLLTKGPAGNHLQNYIPIIVPRLFAFSDNANSPDKKMEILKKNSLYRGSAWKMAEKVIRPLVNYCSNPNIDNLNSMKLSLGYVASHYNTDEFDIKAKINEAWKYPAFLTIHFGFTISDYISLTEVGQIVAQIITSYISPSELTFQSQLLDRILSSEKVEPLKTDITKKKASKIQKLYLEEVLNHSDLLQIGDMTIIPIGNKEYCGSTMVLCCGIAYQELGLCYFHKLNAMSFVFLATFFKSIDLSVFKYLFLGNMKYVYPNEIRMNGYSQSTYQLLEEMIHKGDWCFAKIRNELAKSPTEKILIDQVPGTNLSYEEWD